MKQIRTGWIQIVFSMMIIGLVLLIVRIAYINAVLGDRLLDDYAARQYTSGRPIPAQRGTIYDRRGRILAASHEAQCLFADPAIIANRPAVAERLAPYLNQPAETVLARLDRRPNSRFVRLKRDLPRELVSTIMGLEIHGLGILSEPKRVYPSQDLAAHVLGLVSIGEDGPEGLEGLELQHNATLGGQDGYETFIRDAHSHRIWLVNSGYRPAVDGESIILTIDQVIQEFTERILHETCTKFHARSASAIVMDPTNGDILAWACWPTFDANRFNIYPAETRRNRGVTDPFEPGSAFKPFVAVAALKHKVANWQEKIFCHNGAYTIGRRVLHDHHGYGDLSFADIVIHSSNIGMGILGQRLGNARLHQAVTAFGFGEKTGIDLPGESAGIVRPLRKWNDYSTTSIPMGQEIGATSIQLLTAFAALANDGLMLRPRILRAKVDSAGNIYHDNTEPQPIRQAIEPEFARAMVQQVLTQVVERGTGRSARIPGYLVFGKTGTAQIPRADGRGYEPRAYVSTFMGGVPAGVPQLVAVVSVRRPDPKVGYYGGTVAAPAVKSILENTLKYLGIPPEKQSEPSERIQVTAG